MTAPAVDLLASYWTLAGDVYPLAPSEVSPFPFRERVAVASAAGFTGIGLVHHDLMAVAADIGLAEMRRILDGHGIRHVELEFLTDWWVQDGARARASAAMRRELFEAAEALGARDVKIAPEYGVEGIDLPLQMEAFAGVCRDAAEVGTAIAIEFLPFSNVPTLEVAMAIVDGSGAANGGLCVDIWHVVRGDISYADVAALRPGAIVSVELDDAGEPVGELWDDTILHRRVCGEGEFDIPGFISAVRAAGWDGFYGVEIIAKDHRLLPLDEAAQRSYDTAIAQFAEHA